MLQMPAVLVVIGIGGAIGQIGPSGGLVLDLLALIGTLIGVGEGIKMIGIAKILVTGALLPGEGMIVTTVVKKVTGLGIVLLFSAISAISMVIPPLIVEGVGIDEMIEVAVGVVRVVLVVVKVLDRPGSWTRVLEAQVLKADYMAASSKR